MIRLGRAESLSRDTPAQEVKNITPVHHMHQTLYEINYDGISVKKSVLDVTIESSNQSRTSWEELVRGFLSGMGVAIWLWSWRH